MANKLGSPKVVPIASGTTLVAGQLYVSGDTNLPFVAPRTDTAANIAASLGIVSNIRTIDLPARVGAFPDTGRGIFD